MAGNSLTLLLVIAGICIVIGSVFGWMMGSLRSSSEPEKTKIQPVPQPSAPQPVVVRPPALLRLVRDTDTGSLNVELDTRLAKSADQFSADERKRVIDLLKETSVWLGLIPPPAGAPVSVHAPVAAVQNPPSVPLVVSTAGSVEPIKPTTVIGGLTNAVANVLGPAPVIKEAPKSMVQQIDEILQARLAVSPLAAQKIVLVEDPRRGVLVCVGSETYEGIGSVPEGAVKNLLKASVQDWENQQEELRRRKKP